MLIWVDYILHYLSYRKKNQSVIKPQVEGSMILLLSLFGSELWSKEYAWITNGRGVG